jgi:hypothetical protein
MRRSAREPAGGAAFAGCTEVRSNLIEMRESFAAISNLFGPLAIAATALSPPLAPLAKPRKIAAFERSQQFALNERTQRRQLTTCWREPRSIRKNF